MTCKKKFDLCDFIVEEVKFEKRLFAKQKYKVEVSPVQVTSSRIVFFMIT